MLVLQECIVKLEKFKETFSQKFGITKLGIFGSVARNENTEDSDISKLLDTSEGALKASYHIAVKKISEFFKARD